MTKKLKKCVDLDKIGIQITEMKHTRNEAISMAVGRGTESACVAEKLKEAVEAVLSPDAGVRLQTNLLCLEISGMSIDDDQDDVRDAMQRGVSRAQDRVNWL